ncbi:MAG: hypothetical protein AAB554_02115 [Patescibacteria group bacterium]
MKNVLIATIIVLSVGCVSNARYAAMERRNAELERKDLEWRRANAKRDGYRPPGAPQLPTADPTLPAVNDGMMGGGQASTGAMWARQKHGVYMGTVGEQPRQVTQGRKIKVTNQVCDDGARGFVCDDVDLNGEPDFNTWLSFEIDDQPAVCDSGVFHPQMQVSMLLPLQTCFVEIGAARMVKLKIRFFRNNGNPWSYAMLDATPYKTITKVYTIANGTAKLTVEENTTSAY